MKSKLPLVCIVILNWNGQKMTYDCLESLKKKTSYKNYKVIVIDNGSTDGSDLYIEKNYPWVDLVKSPINRGYTGGMNMGWKHAIGKYHPDYLCNLNSDIITIQSSWLANMVDYMQENPSVGLTGCKLLSPDKKLAQWLDIKRKIIQIRDLSKNKVDSVIKVDALGGPIYLIKMELINKVGFNDENIFFGPDDYDYCLRSRKKGFELAYIGSSEAVHVGCYSYNLANKKTKKKKKNNFIFGEHMKGKMIFAFRHGNIKEKISMPLKHIFRVFFTRINPTQNWSVTNTEFHFDFLKRGYIFLIKFFEALRDYKKIKCSEFSF